MFLSGYKNLTSLAQSFLNANTLMCTLPPSSGPGQVHVTLSYSPQPDSPALGTSIAKFEYYAESKYL